VGLLFLNTFDYGSVNKFLDTIQDEDLKSNILSVYESLDIYSLHI